MNDHGEIAAAPLFDSSGVSIAGCIIGNPVNSVLIGPCFTPKDTLLINVCNNGSVMLPWRRFAGHTFYSAMPFVPANVYNPFIPITTSGIYWAVYSNGFGCSDTTRIQAILTPCPDIDDDNDGIPDYVEFDDPLALADHNSNGIPNWNDPAYPGFVDNNFDGVNDNFDWGCDADNDGIPNFQDLDYWKGWVDVNSDGINDKADKDMDGIPNQYDLDSDNDGLPDVVESYGVDTDGNGIIDNYIDTDTDGFSQNVDANNSGVNDSGTGLGAPDFDNDGIPNYLDLDSDNDAIPDIVESGGVDANNNGLVDGFIDSDGNGIDDNHFVATAILLTGGDISPVDGRADDYPNKNKDRDFRPNAYDMDSDGDGIVDVIEAGLPDADLNGVVDGTIASNGWSTSVSSLGALGLRTTDSDPYPDYLDIDSDDDGIPDNIEGQATAGYRLPVATDTDGDGLVNIYDNVNGFGGSGIFVYDHNANGTPDYRDSDSDGDGLADIVEGNDFNLNGIPDDNVTLTGIDTDGDGLDNRFDSLNSVTNLEGTSYRMGNFGSFSGDPTPGSRTVVQRTQLTQPDRDWRFVGYVLPVDFLNLAGIVQNDLVSLSWSVIASKEVDHFDIERSTDNNTYTNTGQVWDPVQVNKVQQFSFTDDIYNLNATVIYYRIRVIGKKGDTKYSNILVVRTQKERTIFSIAPNPARDNVSLTFESKKDADIIIRLIDYSGKAVLIQNQQVSKGINTVRLSGLKKFSTGIYNVQVFMNDEIISTKLYLVK